jgi:hypothetical protein
MKIRRDPHDSWPVSADLTESPKKPKLGQVSTRLREIPAGIEEFD